MTRAQKKHVCFVKPFVSSFFFLLAKGADLVKSVFINWDVWVSVIQSAIQIKLNKKDKIVANLSVSFLTLVCVDHNASF